MKLTRSVALALTTAVAVLVPTAAQADGSGHTDATGDLQSVTIDGGGHVTDATAVPEPTATLGDITAVRALNGARKVKVVMHFAYLHRAGEAQVYSVLIITPKGARVAIVQASPGRWGGKAFLANPRGKKVSCAVGHRISYDRNKVVVQVPQSCLGQPKVIEVGARSFIGEGTKLFYDDAYNSGGTIASAYGLSPMVRR